MEDLSTFDTCTQLFYIFDTGVRSGLFPFHAISNADLLDAVGYVQPSFNFDSNAF